jgi:hypothetical protein
MNNEEIDIFELEPHLKPFSMYDNGRLTVVSEAEWLGIEETSQT